MPAKSGNKKAGNKNSQTYEDSDQSDDDELEEALAAGVNAMEIVTACAAGGAAGGASGSATGGGAAGAFIFQNNTSRFLTLSRWNRTRSISLQLDH